MLEDVLREGWETAKSSESLKPIADPSVRNLKFEEGSPIEFDLLIEVRPEIKLDRIGGFKVERTVPAVSDAAVDERVASLQEAKAAWIPVTGEKPSPGHMVRVEVAPIEDGTAGNAQPYDLVLGQNQAIPELEERIMGLLPGETTETDVQLPRGPPRREPARPEPPGADRAARGQAPGAAGARRRVRPGDGRLRERRRVRTAVRHDLEREAEREADAQLRPRCSPRWSRPTASRPRSRWCTA